MNEIPLGAKLAATAVFGLVVGAIVNLAVYALAWESLPLSPWQHATTGRPRAWSERLPLFGWLRRGHEAAELGPRFWVRPLVVELGCAVGVPALYWWEVARLALLPAPLAQLGMMPEWVAPVQAQFAVHVLLLMLMLAASLIDIDEKNIPDGITVPGTLVLLAAAALAPHALLPVFTIAPGAPGAPPALPRMEFLSLAAPHAWPQALAQPRDGRVLALALGLYLAWCAALLPRVWRPRRGRLFALRMAAAYVRRDPFSKTVAGLAVLGSAAIFACWQADGDSWRGLVTALVGMAVAGGLVWLVRVLGGLMLGKEAMGFGDVTLMGMIGAYVGWQMGLVVFFLAPFFGLALGVAQWVLRREPEIPYGPFLCLATTAVVLFWPRVWQATEVYFAVGWLIPAVLLVCLAGLVALLAAWRLAAGWLELGGEE